MSGIKVRVCDEVSLLPYNYYVWVFADVELISRSGMFVMGNSLYSGVKHLSLRLV